MPTVATDVGGVSEATGDAGLIVPPKNPEATAAACLRLLSDADLRHSIGRAARARILSLFTLEQSLAIFGDLYREVTGRVTTAHVVRHEQDLSRTGQAARVPHRGRSIRRSDLPTVSRAGLALLGTGPNGRCGP